MTEYKNEEISQAFLNAFSDTAILLDPDGTVVGINSVGAQDFNRPIDRIIGKNVYNLLPGDVSKSRKKWVKLACRSGKTVRFKDESSGRIYEHTLSPVFDLDGKVSVVIATARDITSLENTDKIMEIERDVALAISSSQDLVKALDSVLEIVTSLDGIDCGLVYMVDEKTGGIELVSSSGLSCDFVNMATHLDMNTPQADLITQGKPIYINQSESVPELGRLRGDEGLRAIAVIPVVFEGKVVGGFNLSSRSFREMPEYIKYALETVAAQIGNAMERFRIYRILNESEKKYRQFYQSSLDGYVMVDMEGKVVECNESYKRMIGYDEDELIGKPYSEFTPGKWHSLDERVLEEQVFQRGYSDLYEKEYIHKNGGVFPIEIQKYRVTDSENNPIGTWAFVRDISKRKFAEDALNRQHGIVNSILELSPSAILVINRYGDIIYANQMAEKLLGRTNKEIVGMFFNSPEWQLEDFEGNPFPHDQLLVTRVIQSGRPVFDVRHVIGNPDGKKVYCSINGAPIFADDGSIDKVVITLEDISEMITMENQIRNSNEEIDESNRALEKVNDDLRTAKASGESSDRLKSVFIANMANEIKAPTVAISDYSEKLLEDETLSEERKKLIRKLKASSSLLLNIVNDFNDISTIDQGQVKVENSVLDIHKVLANVEKNANFMISQFSRAITLKKNISEKISRFIYGDSKKIHQVLFNLINNSVKNTSRGYIEFGVTKPEENSVEFYVSDTGSGIPDDIQQSLFKEHVEEENSYCSIRRKNAVGLAVSMELVELMGGTIRFVTKTGKNSGSTFYFTIPYRPEHDSSSQEDSQKREQHRYNTA